MCLGIFWAFTAIAGVGCALLGILGFIVKSLVGYDCDQSAYLTDAHLKSECDDITEIGMYMSIASAAVFVVVSLLSTCLCCFGCCCQQVDERKLQNCTNDILEFEFQLIVVSAEREDTVTFVRVV